MTAIVSWCLRRRSVVILASVLILGAGAFGATQLRQQFFPDVDFPFVITNLDVSGLDAEGVDEQVAQPLEGATSNLEDVETTQTLSSEGRVTLVTELAYGTDTKQFEEDLARELASVQLPEGAGELDIGGGFDEQAVLNAAMSTDGDLLTLTEQAEDVRDELENIDGVGRVELDGGAEKEFAVELKRRAVRRGETPGSLATKIQSALREAPVGLVERAGSRTPLLVDPGTVDNRRELERLPISDRREVEDVATVRRQAAEGTGVARTNGKPSIALSVFTEEDANQVQVVDESEAVLARAQRALGGVEVSTIFETASDVKASVNGLLLEGTLGALFAVVVIFFFLRSVRPTLVAAVSIPTSIVFGLLAAWALGLTLNIITLAGLTIAIGRVIDDAIVVLENIYKHLERGEPRAQSALEGTSEVANAIVSSTLATAAVFLPLGLVGGLISEIFFSFSIIVVVALLASLLVAVTVIPVLGATFMKPKGRPVQEAGALARIVTPITRFGIRPFGRIAVIAAAFAALIGTISVVAGGGIPVQFLPDSGTQQASGTVDLPAGVGPERAERLLRPLEKRLNGIDGIENAQVTFGGAGVQTDEVEDTENGAFFANFREGVDVERVTADLRGFGEREYPDGFTADRLESGPPAGQFEATVIGEDQEDAERGATRVTKLLEGREDLTQVDNEAASEQTQFVLEVDEDERGTEDQQRATEALAALVPPADAGTIGDDDVPVVVRAPEELLEDANALEDIPLAPRASDALGGAPMGGVPPAGGAPPAGALPPAGAVPPMGAVPSMGAMPPAGAVPPGGAPPAGGAPPGGGAPASRERPPDPRPHCSDRVDNDSDGTTDFGKDPGCESATDDSEAPDPRCSDRLDNDSDGRTDLGDDPGCESATDDSEAPDPSKSGARSFGVAGGASSSRTRSGGDIKQSPGVNVTPAASVGASEEAPAGAPPAGAGGSGVVAAPGG
ncbi:MAG: efflux RND transporter permease subunit, partial [Actinomycetota bacterium]|nr:efflux RND transporter permease subunit [Actinomycetota bacterium]